MNMKGFTTKRAEIQTHVFMHLSEASAGRKTVRGFTLIETMVAVTILTLAIAGPLVTANRAILAARISRDQLTASYLAQEGIEYVRAMRDKEYLLAYQAGGASVSDTAWSNFLNTSINQCRSSVCTLDPSRSMGSGVGLALAPCSGSCAPLYLTQLSDGTYGYTQQGGTATPFTRTIQAIDVSGSDERVVSNVSWSYHGTPYTVTVSDHLTPWQ